LNKIKIVHIADVHIVNNPEEHYKYREQFQKLYKELDIIKPDKIVIVGDTLDAFITTTLESETLASELLDKLSNYCEVIVVPGNHEIRKKDLKRVSSIGSIVKMMNNRNIVFLDKSGFFEDNSEDIIWVNYSHLEKRIIPWKNIQHNKDKNKIYIGLFHDPVFGSKLPTGINMNSKNLIKLSEFKNNDLNLFGDIHLRQFFNDTTAYPGSLIQLSFGEKTNNHGFILWEIDENKNISYKEYNLQNDYTKITFEINKDYDYDLIDFNHKLITNKSKVKIKWTDYTSNVNNENERKINKYIKNKFDIDEVVYEKTRIYSDIISSDSLNESINVNDKIIQQNIFKEYLKANKFEDDFIDEILNIDDIINDRLELSTTTNNVQWNIEQFWLDNFKSYNKETIDWNDIHGIIQLHSEENQMGKTTLLDGICYITHGTTLATNKLGGGKTEKFGDNRYINNKRNLDNCSGGMIININGQQYTVLRETIRSWTSKETIKSVSTDVNYYLGIEIKEEKKLRGERKTETQLMINAIVGDFSDFIRLALINSENLNDLISIDRATFIDSIIRDAGYDIFEKKLAVFKDYKKEIVVNKISLNLSDTEIEMNKLSQMLRTYQKEKLDFIEEKSGVTFSLSIFNTDRDNEFKKLNKIDDDVSKLNIDNINEKIKEYQNTIKINLNQQKINSKTMLTLKISYDKEQYETLLKSLKTLDDHILNLKLKLSQLDSKNSTLDNNVKNLELKKEQLKDKDITKQKMILKNIEIEIDKLNNEFENYLNNEKRKIIDKRTDIKFKIKSIKQELSNIKEKGIELKKRIKEIEESTICPTCFRPYEENNEHNIKEKISQLKQQIEDLMPDVKKYQLELKEKTKLNSELKEKIENLETGVYSSKIEKFKNEIILKIDDKSDEIDEINNICKNIKKNIFSKELKLNIDKITEEQNILEEKIEKNIKLKSEGNKRVKEKSIEKSNTQDDINKIQKDKEESRTYETFLYNNNELSLKIANIKLTIENAEEKINKYYNHIKFIEQNQLINEKINEYDGKINKFKNEIEDLNSNINETINNINIIENSILDISENMEKYKKQVHLEEILKEYQRCVHRDGIPTFLLMKSKDLINQELSDLLSTVDFNIFFDEKLNLKMYMEFAQDIVQNLLEGSGAERTFSAIALKLALRTINHKSKPNFLLLDEITGKLVNKSIGYFKDMLEKMKDKIDKIIIIEHNHPINFDALIEVLKDDKGISSLKITY